MHTFLIRAPLCGRPILISLSGRLFVRLFALFSTRDRFSRAYIFFLPMAQSPPQNVLSLPWHWAMFLAMQKKCNVLNSNYIFIYNFSLTRVKVKNWKFNHKWLKNEQNKCKNSNIDSTLVLLKKGSVKHVILQKNSSITRGK